MLASSRSATASTPTSARHASSICPIRNEIRRLAAPPCPGLRVTRRSPPAALQVLLHSANRSRSAAPARASVASFFAHPAFDQLRPCALRCSRFPRPLFPVPPRRGNLLFDLSHTRPLAEHAVDARKGLLGPAPPLFEARQLRGDLGGVLLARSRAVRDSITRRCSSSIPASACCWSASRRTASSRRCSRKLSFPARASRFRSLSSVQSCSRRSRR